MEQWEYFVKDIYADAENSPNGQTKILNFYGEGGWELVAICKDFAYFKRKIENDNQQIKDETIIIRDGVKIKEVKPYGFFVKVGNDD